MKSIRQIVNGAGVIGDRVGLDVKVRFEQAGAKDIVDGVPDLEFSLGNLRFEADADSQPSLFAPDCTPLTIPGAGTYTTILLKGQNSFAIVSAVKEIRINDVDIAQ